MTVRRHSKDYFDAAPLIVAGAVRIVLTKRPPYFKTGEMDEGMFFSTNVRPKWWLLGTDMTIQLQPLSGGTEVVANTNSQWFIMGDVFGYYNRYIRDFLRDLRIELQKPKV